MCIHSSIAGELSFVLNPYNGLFHQHEAPMQPINAVAAASHPDPYPYYRRLLTGPQLVFDPGLQMWIACRQAVIQEILQNPHCQVRPTGEPVPKAIAGSSAGAVFASLMRMNEGTRHAIPRQAIGQALAALDLASVTSTSRHFASTLGAGYGFHDAAAITGWVFDLPTYVVADLLGLDNAELPLMAQSMAHFVRCLSPLSTTEQLADASTAAQALQERFARLIHPNLTRPAGLLANVRRHASVAGWVDEEAIAANLIGLLSQTHEATAGLIGNGIVALLSQPRLQERLRGDHRLAAAFVHEVARFDPPIQNTRRFVAQETRVAGVALQPGDAILLLLAAAGRDEQAHLQPDVFLLEREERTLSGFGHGCHACPGRELAILIATSAIEHLLSLPAALDPATLGWTYRTSLNGRLPEFFTLPLKELP